MASPDGDVSRSPWLLGVIWTEASLATVIVALRFYTRYARRDVRLEDWIMLLSLILFVCAIAGTTVIIHYGLGRHVQYLSEYQISQFTKWNWIVQPFGIMDIPLAKISVSLFILHFLERDSRWRKWFLYINMVLIFVVFMLASIFSYAQCNPPRALWENVPNAKCWDPAIQADWAVFGSAYSTFLDFALALLPISFFWKLQMPMKKKISLSFLLGVGVLSGICAAVKTAMSQELGIREDVTWATVPLYAWGSSEVFLNIVCGCVPTLKPLYNRILKGTPIHSTQKRDRLFAARTTGLSSRSWPSKYGQSSVRSQPGGDDDAILLPPRALYHRQNPSRREILVPKPTVSSEEHSFILER